MQVEVVIDTSGPQVHWLLGDFGVTSCGIALTAPNDPKTTKEAVKISCAKCLTYAMKTENTPGIYKCRECDRFWTTEEYRDLHELSHV